MTQQRAGNEPPARAEPSPDGDRKQRPEALVDFLEILQMQATGEGTLADIARLERRAAERRGELDGVPPEFLDETPPSTS